MLRGKGVYGYVAGEKGGGWGKAVVREEAGAKNLHKYT